MDVPGHPDPLIITDAAVNIAPDLDAKVDIIQNAIDLAHAMGAERGAGGDLKRDGDRDDEGPLHDRSRGPVQDGGARADHGRDPRRAAGARQRHQPGSGGDQEDRIAGCGAREHSRRSRPRGRQHAGQEPLISGEGGRRRNRARRARAGHSHQPRRFIDQPPRVLRGRRHGSGREAARPRPLRFVEGAVDERAHHSAQFSRDRRRSSSAWPTTSSIAYGCAKAFRDRRRRARHFVAEREGEKACRAACAGARGVDCRRGGRHRSRTAGGDVRPDPLEVGPARHPGPFDRLRAQGRSSGRDSQLFGRRLRQGDGRFVPLLRSNGEARRAADDRTAGRCLR